MKQCTEAERALLDRLHSGDFNSDDDAASLREELAFETAKLIVDRMSEDQRAGLVGIIMDRERARKRCSVALMKATADMPTRVADKVCGLLRKFADEALAKEAQS